MIPKKCLSWSWFIIDSLWLRLRCISLFHCWKLTSRINSPLPENLYQERPSPSPGFAASRQSSVVQQGRHYANFCFRPLCSLPCFPLLCECRISQMGKFKFDVDDRGMALLSQKSELASAKRTEFVYALPMRPISQQPQRGLTFQVLFFLLLITLMYCPLF